MNAQPRLEKRLSLLDYAFALLDGVHSPQDFTLILHLRQPPAIANLRLGANSAVNCYPTSGSIVKGRRWVFTGEIPLVSACNIESFIDDPFNPRMQIPIKQMMLANGSLVTRFHHAAADGMSAAMWLGHELSVAYEFKPPANEPSSFSELPLRRSATSVRRSAFAHNGASNSLWTTNYEPSGARRWITINFPATELQQACRRARGFTYNDLLATCALDVFTRWNQKNNHQSRKIGLWLPVNIRRQSWTGFGNGTSRIRLYAKYQQTASIVDKAREIRKQVSWSTEHGEWVVPEWPLFTCLPRPLVAPVLNGYLKQPSVDMATGVFSHADRWAGDAAEAFKHVTRIEGIGLLHPRQHLAINGATHQRQTWLTFTYDSGLFDADHAHELAHMYEDQIARARKELL